MRPQGDSAAPVQLQALQAEGAQALCAPGFDRVLAELGLLAGPHVLDALRVPAGASAGRAATRLAKIDDGRELIIRQFRRGGWLARLGRPHRLASPGRLFDELRVGCELRRRGAPVPEPAFAVGWRKAGASRGWEGAVASVRIAGAIDAASYAQSADRSTDSLATAAVSCGRALRAFHDRGGRHADLHLGNLLVSESGDAAWVVDLDRARVGAPATTRRRAREFARLARSIEKRGLGPRIGSVGVARFLEAYLAGDAALGSSIARAWRSERLAIALHRLGY